MKGRTAAAVLVTLLMPSMTASASAPARIPWPHLPVTSFMHCLEASGHAVGFTKSPAAVNGKTTASINIYKYPATYNGPGQQWVVSWMQGKPVEATIDLYANLFVMPSDHVAQLLAAHLRATRPKGIFYQVFLYQEVVLSSELIGASPTKSDRVHAALLANCARAAA